jgi:ribosome-binding ATPase YchF (GTP1/OBG family)
MFAAEEKKEFLSALNVHDDSLSKIAKAGFAILNNITYYTVGEKETRAWTVKKSAKAPEAAGVIHTDFEKGFIKAEVVSFEDFISLGGEAEARKNGKLRLEGKEYIVQDGDVMHFKFNV